MAFRKKADLIFAHEPDILIVPECECPDKLLWEFENSYPMDILWFGKNKNKGLAIFSRKTLKLKLLDNHNENLQMIIPILVIGDNFKFNLLAVWANNPNDRDGQYVEQVWKAIHHYDDLLSNQPAMIIGDFNSNTIWDKNHRIGSHSQVVKYLEEKDIFSSYHLYNNQIQGKELHPTLYMYRHKNKPYHIDYCFISANFVNIQSVEIGEYDYWSKHSDHMPVTIMFDIINHN